MNTLWKRGAKEEYLLEMVERSRPVLHERCLLLLLNFLEYKKDHGTEIEKQIYNDLSVLGLVDRLLIKVQSNFQ